MLSQFFPPTIGGEERHVKVLSEALVQRGHDVSVATIKQGDDQEFEIINGVKVHRLQGWLQRNRGLFTESQRRHAPPFPDPELTFRLNRVMREERPDIVHAHNWLLHSYLPLQRIYRKKIIVTLHDYGSVCAKKNMIHEGVPCNGPSFSKCLPCSAAHYGGVKGAVTWFANSSVGRFGLDQVDTFIPVSRAVADRCKLDEAGRRYEIIPTFIADDARELSPVPDPRLNELPNSDFLLFVGDLSRLKGVKTLLDAYQRLESAPPLVLIGRRCKDTPSTIPNNVMLFESWPHHTVLHAWSRCLFGIVPSEGLETCGTVVMEANIFGKPVIACKTGGLVDTVADGKTGILVPPGDANALLRALQTMLGDTSLRNKFAKASFAHAEGYLTKAIVPRIERLYAEQSRPLSSLGRTL
jgi:glycosyltransferase involved in cell wall biosynthesis